MYDHRRLKANPTEYDKEWMAEYLDECQKMDAWTSANITPIMNESNPVPDWHANPETR